METKSQMINRIAELSQENAELKAENERLKSQFQIESLTDTTTGETIYRSNLINNLQEVSGSFALKKVIEYDSRYNDMQAEIDCGEKMIEKYQNALQEIKAIAEENKDTVQYGGICRSILMEITKAEEE